MRRALRWAGYIAGGVLILALLGAAYVWIASARMLSSSGKAKLERLLPLEQASLENGRHIMTTRGCADCHGAGLSGASFLDDPKVAVIYAPNLTAIARKASDQQLAQAIRQGISHDGRALMIMPSESYSALTDAETSDLIKAIRALPALGKPSPPPKIGPLARVGLLNGQFKTAPQRIADYAAAQPLDPGPQFASGRHIAVTVCSGCHGSTLSGSEVEPGVLAPDLNVAGAYDLPAFTRLLRTGRPISNRELRMMSGVARQSFSSFTDPEIADLHAYLVERAQRSH